MAAEHHINAAELDGHPGVIAVMLGITSGGDPWRLSGRADMRWSQWHRQEARQRLGLRLMCRQAALRLLLQHIAPFEERRLGKPALQTKLAQAES